MDNLQTPPTMNGSAPKQGNGSTAAIVIILLIVALAGAYFWFSKSRDAGEMMQSAGGASDKSLEQELNVAANADVEAELQSMDKEFE